MNKIELKNYCKEIKENSVLSDVSYTFYEGKLYKIVGTNGSGKTMLLRALSGLMYPTSGEIYVNSVLLDCNTEYPVTLGVIIETPSFWSNYTGREMLQYLAKIRDVISDDEINESMHRVGLNPEDKRKIGKYSLGMRQKLAIAQAIMEKPDFIFLDEPLNALDADGIARFTRIVNEEKERGAIVVIATHNDSDRDILYDAIIKIENGRIVNDIGDEMLNE